MLRLIASRHDDDDELLLRLIGSRIMRFRLVPKSMTLDDPDWVGEQAIFGDLGGYFLGNVSHKTSNITWQHATPCSASN